MKFIGISIFLEISFDNVDQSLLKNPSLTEDLKMYYALEYHLNKFKGVDPLQLYYNQYSCNILSPYRFSIWVYSPKVHAFLINSFYFLATQV